MFRGGYGALTVLRKHAVATLAAMMLPAPLLAGALTLTAMGDSLTQGYGLPQEQGFVPVLEQWLRDRGHDVNVINAGVSGDTTAGGLARIGWTLADSPDALIVAFGGNDLLRGIDPAASRANLAGILQAAADGGVPVLLAGLPAPGNFGPDFQRDFEAMYTELAEEYGTLLVADFLAPITAEVQAGRPIAGLMQSDNIHPAPEGVRRIVDALGPEVERLLERAAAARDGAG